MNHESIVQEVCLELARLLSIGPDEIDLSCSLGELGLDSLGYVDFASFIEKRYGIPLSPDLLFDHDTLAGTVAHIGGMLAANGEA